MANQFDARTGRRSEPFMRHAMREHGTPVYLVALSATRSHCDAQDVAQDVFCRLLNDPTVFSSEEHLKAWLLRVTVNRCHELARMPWRHRVDSADATGVELVDPAPSVEDAALRALEENPVWQALRALGPKLREVAHLHYVEECPTEEIARIVGCPTTTVRTRLHRARTQMRQTLGGNGG